MACPHKPTCELYGHFVTSSFLEVWKIRYCDKDEAGHAKCQRYQLSARGERVPSNLLPNGAVLPIADRGGKCG